MGIQINGQTDTISAFDNNFSLAGNVSIGGTLTYEDVTSVDSVGIVTSRNIIFSGSTGTAGQFVLRRDSDGANIGQFRSDAGTNDISIGNGGSGSLILKTGANTERLRITAAGKVGIGTNNPPAKLSVDGSVIFGNTTSSGSGGTLRIVESVNSVYIQPGSNTSNDSSCDLIFSSINGVTEKLRITAAGKIGINETAPAADLVVKQSGNTFTTQSQTVALFQRSSTAGHGAKIAIIGGNAAISQVNFGDTDSEEVGMIQYFHTDNSLRFITNTSEKLHITSDGKIGINEISPSAILEVKGAVSAGSGNNEDLQRWNIASDNVKAEIKYIDTAADRGMLFGTTTDHILSFQTNNTEKLRITSDGHLQIRREGIGNFSGTDSRHTRYIIKQTNGQEAIAGSVFAQGKSDWGGDLVFATKQATANPSTGLTETMRLNAAGYLKIPYQPRFFAYGTSSVNQTTSGYHTWSTFTTTRFNVGSHFSTTSKIFTAPIAGCYAFGCNCRIDGGGTGYFRIILSINGSSNDNEQGHSIRKADAASGSYHTQSVTALYQLNAGQGVSVLVESNSDSSWSMQSESQFWGYLVA